MSPDVVAVANLLASLAAAFGLFFVAWQTREAARARELQATLAIFDDFGSDEMRELRRFVYNELPQDPADFASETLKKVEKLTSAFGRAAVLCRPTLHAGDGLLSRLSEGSRFSGESCPRSIVRYPPHP